LSSRRNAGRIASYATEIATPKTSKKTSNMGGLFIASCLRSLMFLSIVILKGVVLGAVNTHQLLLPCPIFFSARQNESGLVVPNKRILTPLREKWGRPFGSMLKRRHAALLVTHIEPPNLAPLALLGVFSASTVVIGVC